VGDGGSTPPRPKSLIGHQHNSFSPAVPPINCPSLGAERASRRRRLFLYHRPGGGYNSWETCGRCAAGRDVCPEGVDHRRAEILTMATKKSVGWILLGRIIVLGICSFGSFQLLVKRCLFWTCAPDRNFSVLDLGIPSSYFPENSVVGEIDYSSELDGATEHGHQQIFWRKGNGLANYLVWRFGTEWQAQSFIESLNQMDLKYGLTTCSELRDVEVRADEYSLTCGWDRFGGYRAELNAKYEEYVIALNVVIDGEMSLEQFQQVVVFIDNQMQQKLSSK
jgi:hypothetical protein